jgi:hypothetical protein
MNAMKIKQQVLFVHGGGDGGYEADTKLVTSLQKALGPDYDIDYSEIYFDESASDFGWTQQIEEKMAGSKDDVILVGHSFGASMILKCLSENSGHKKMKGIFLIAPPFWSGNEEWKQGIKLQKDFADKLANQTPIFFYHCKDDDEVPFSQFNDYKKHLNRATYREMESGGHQLNNDLSIVAQDIKSL